MNWKLALGALALAAPIVVAAQAYPSKPIKLVTAFAAGSATDVAARLVADYIGKTTGQAVVVDNRAGASGMLAAQAVAQSLADGYTALVTTQAHVTNPNFFRKLPYDTMMDFIPVSTVARSALVVVAAPGLPANNIAELVALAKRQPGKLSFGAGNASSRVGAELLKMQTGTDLLHVPYKSMPQVITDLIGQQVQLAWADVVTGLPQVKAGKLKALGTTGAQRMKATPEVPTLIEQGIAGHAVYGWTAVYLPANTPADIVGRLNELVQAAIKADPAHFERLGSEAFPQSTADFARFNAAELATWARVAKAAGIEPE